VLAVLLGLGSATLWGVSDFIGGVLARRVPALYVAFVGQAASLTVLGAVVLAAGPERPSLAQLAPTALAGVFGLAAFFHAFSIGTISIAAPIAATGVVIPVTIGQLGGDRVAPTQLAGIALVIAGVAASRSRSSRRSRSACSSQASTRPPTRAPALPHAERARHAPHRLGRARRARRDGRPLDGKPMPWCVSPEVPPPALARG
jgi:uncharacterized membrane protein